MRTPLLGFVVMAACSNGPVTVTVTGAALGYLRPNSIARFAGSCDVPLRYRRFPANLDINCYEPRRGWPDLDPALGLAASTPAWRVSLEPRSGAISAVSISVSPPEDLATAVKARVPRLFDKDAARILIESLDLPAGIGPNSLIDIQRHSSEAVPGFFAPTEEIYWDVRFHVQ